MQKPKASVILANWNRRSDLLNCLKTLAEQSYQNTEVIVVDNASTDGSAEAAQAGYPDTILIRNKENRGFAQANNIGFRKATGEYLLTINNDAEASPQWIEELVRAAQSRNDVGMCASKMLLYYERDIIDSAGITIDMAGYSTDRGFGQKDAGRYDTEEDVFGPCGGAALYKREMLEDVKLEGDFFDSGYFTYNEDTDLAWRAQLRGWKCLYAPTAVVYHKHSASSSEKSPRKIFYTTRNSMETFIKNSSTKNLLLLAPYLAAYKVAVIPYYLGIGRAVPYTEALASVLTDLPHTLKKRRSIQSRITTPHKDIDIWFSLESPACKFRRAKKAGEVEEGLKTKDCGKPGFKL